MAGAELCALTVVAQDGLILAGHLTPLILFLPGGFMSFSQGLSLPSAQAGAMRVRPELAGTAAGLGVFIQMMLSALSAQIYSLVANDTPLPMIAISSVGTVFSLACAGALIPGSPRAAQPPLAATMAEMKET